MAEKTLKQTRQELYDERGLARDARDERKYDVALAVDELVVARDRLTLAEGKLAQLVEAYAEALHAERGGE